MMIENRKRKKTNSICFHIISSIEVVKINLHYSSFYNLSNALLDVFIRILFDNTRKLISHNREHSSDAAQDENNCKYSYLKCNHSLTTPLVLFFYFFSSILFAFCALKYSRIVSFSLILLYKYQRQYCRHTNNCKTEPYNLLFFFKDFYSVYRWFVTMGNKQNKGVSTELTAKRL